MASIKLRAKLLLRRIEAMGMTVAKFAEANLEDTSVWMGLETYLEDDTAGKIRRQRKLISAMVKKEQQRQNAAGINDPDAMAKVSEAVSKWSRTRAEVIGLLHADKKM